MNDGVATWQVTGSCSTGAASAVGPIVDRAKPELCITARSEVVDGEQVNLQTCGVSLSKLQQFEYKEGRIHLKAAGNDWCLAVGAGSSVNGAKVQSWSCDGATNHRWLKGADGTLRPLHALQMCVDVTLRQHSPGTALQLLNCKDSTAKLFWADFVPYLEGRAGIITLKSNLALCMVAPVLWYKERVELQPCSTSSSSSSRFAHQSDGTLRWEETEWCLDVFNFGASDGAEVVVWGCTGLPKRWWKDADGALRPLHALDYCLDVAGGVLTPGRALQLWKCNRSGAQLFAADWMPSLPGAVYLGCFRDQASAPVLPDLLSESLTASNTTEQCWQLAARSFATDNAFVPEERVLPLFGVSGRKCFGGRNLAQATALGPAPEPACAASAPDVVALYQFVQPGGPIPRGCVTDKRAFVKGLPAEEEFSKAIKDATPASYAIAKAFGQMKGAKYFAVSGAGQDWGWTFGAEPTTAMLLNVTVNGSLGCYTPCDDDASKACGSGDGSGGATAPRMWFVYEFPG